MAEMMGTTPPTANLGLKLFSLLVATALWFFVTGEQESSVTVQVPVSVVNLSPGVTVVGPPIAPLVMRLTGSRIKLRRAEKSDLRVVLDCTGVTSGSVAFDSFEKMVKLPVGVDVTRVSPASLHLQLLAPAVTPTK